MYPKAESEWIAEHFFDSKQSLKATERVLCGELSFFEYVAWLRSFFEDAHGEYVRYDAAMKNEERRLHG